MELDTQNPAMNPVRVERVQHLVLGSLDVELQQIEMGMPKLIHDRRDRSARSHKRGSEPAQHHGGASVSLVVEPKPALSIATTYRPGMEDEILRQVRLLDERH